MTPDWLADDQSELSSTACGEIPTSSWPLVTLLGGVRENTEVIIPLKSAPSRGGSGPPSKSYFLVPSRVHIPNGISIGYAVFAGLTVVTDRETDRQTDHATTSVAMAAFS